MSWKTKQMLQKWGTYAAIALGLFIGYTHMQRGGRATVGSVLTSTRVAVQRLPVLGSYFRKGRHSWSPLRSSGRSYAYGRRGKRHYARGRRSRRHRR
ncbi:hypothetical protein K2X33_11265 [bacterium]|nr:hypothetical protein [bacterium]